MKQPAVKDLEKVKTDDPFDEKVEEVKKQVKAEGVKAKPTSHSLLDRNTDYINKIAFETSQKRGKMISASEALRIIIDEHQTGARP